MEQINRSLSLLETENKDLVAQNDRLKDRLAEMRQKVGGLKNEKGALEETVNEKKLNNDSKLKEADSLIRELTETLKRRETEMRLALEENQKLLLEIERQ